MPQLRSLHNPSKKFWRYSLLVLAVVLAVFALEHIDDTYQLELLDERSNEINEDLTLISAEIEAQINSSIYLSSALSIYIKVSPNSKPEEWQKIAKEILAQNSIIKNIAVIRDYVITFIYPLEGNEDALGFDIRENTENWQGLVQGKDRRHQYLIGPMELVQGGIALISNAPVYIGEPPNDRRWGMTSVAYDFKYIESYLKEVEEKYHLNIAAKVNHNNPELSKVFFGSNTIFESADVKTLVRFLSSSWVLAAKFNDDKEVAWYKKHLVSLVGYPLVILLFSFFYMFNRFYSYLYSASMHDELTQLANRRSVMWYLHNAFESYQVSKTPFAIINIDLDRFKPINDTFGHKAGDAVLQEVARRMCKSIRSSDMCARTGGDEFLIALSGVGEAEKAQQLVEKVATQLTSEPVIFNNICIEVEASFGFAIFPNDGKDIEALLSAADANMYIQKTAKIK